jgi:uncharacterized protein (DUF58 family)
MTSEDANAAVRSYQFNRRFIDPTVLAGLRNLSLVAKTVVEGFISGLHRSPYHGFSLDFAEYRMYAPGDDIRAVDWKVYARSDRFYVKKYEGDTNTQLYLLLDCSKSMAFGSHGLSKLDYGRFLAASLAYMARRQKDAVGLLTFDSKLIRSTPARTRRGQYQTILHHLDESEDGMETDISSALEEISNFTRKRCLVALISDLYVSPEEVTRALRILHSRGNDLVVFHVLDPAELALPFSAVSTLEDMETGHRQVFAPESRQSYLEEIQAHIKGLKEASAEMYVDYQILKTDEPLDLALRQYLMARARNY